MFKKYDYLTETRKFSKTYECTEKGFMGDPGLYKQLLCLQKRTTPAVQWP